jgi:hypothetical protein
MEDELKTVKEWIPAFYDTLDGNTMLDILESAKVWDRECESEIKANQHIISYLECYRAWIDGFIRSRQNSIEYYQRFYNIQDDDTTRD